MPSSKAAELLDYYEILGLEAGCSKSDISKAYRKKSLAVHPDRYKGSDPEWAVAEFHRLVQAKEVLEDDKARAAFDALIRARNAHKEKQKAQEAGRKKLREELEAREADAKRQRFEPSAAEMAARQQAEEDGARAELEREIAGRGAPAASTAAPPRGATARRRRHDCGSGGAGARARGVGDAGEAALRWRRRRSSRRTRCGRCSLSSARRRARRWRWSAKGVAEFARAEDAHKLMDRARATTRGVRASWVGEAPARPARDAAADARAPPTACRPPAGSAPGARRPPVLLPRGEPQDAVDAAGGRSGARIGRGPRAPRGRDDDATAAGVGAAEARRGDAREEAAAAEPEGQPT